MWYVENTAINKMNPIIIVFFIISTPLVDKMAIAKPVARQLVGAVGHAGG